MNEINPGDYILVQKPPAEHPLIDSWTSYFEKFDKTIQTVTGTSYNLSWGIEVKSLETDTYRSEVFYGPEFVKICPPDRDN